MPTATRTFRVFVSSTFEDLKAERDALQREVFPRLRKLCEANNARFQAIDLRWGVRDEAALDQQTMEICLREIERCQQTGIKTNFILLLGSGTARIGHVCAGIGMALLKARYLWQTVVMHTAHCHAKNVPETELDGKCGQHEQGGNRTTHVLSMICEWNQLDAVMAGGESGLQTPIKVPNCRNEMPMKPQRDRSDDLQTETKAMVSNCHYTGKAGFSSA